MPQVTQAFDACVFDTHRFVKRLTAVGLLLQQAEVLSDEQVKLIQIIHDRLATKDGLIQLEAANKAGFAELKEDITQLKNELTKIEANIAQLGTDTKADLAQLKEDTAYDTSQLKNDVAQLKNDSTQLKSDVAQLTGDTAALKNDVAQLKNDTAELKTDVAQLKSDLIQLEAVLRKDMEIGFAEVRKDMQIVFKNMENKHNDLRKDMDNGFAGVRKDMQIGFKEMETKFEKMANRMLLKLGAIVIGTATLFGPVLKLFPSTPATPIIIQAADLKKALGRAQMPDEAVDKSLEKSVAQ